MCDMSRFNYEKVEKGHWDINPWCVNGLRHRVIMHKSMYLCKQCSSIEGSHVNNCFRERSVIGQLGQQPILERCVLCQDEVSNIDFHLSLKHPKMSPRVIITKHQPHLTPAKRK